MKVVINSLIYLVVRIMNQMKLDTRFTFIADYQKSRSDSDNNNQIIINGIIHGI